MAKRILQEWFAKRALSTCQNKNALLAPFARLYLLCFLNIISVINLQSLCSSNAVAMTVLMSLLVDFILIDNFKLL